MPKADQPLFHITSYAFPSGDRCMCYKHKGRRCNVRNCSVELVRADPDSPRTLRLYCLDCWITCREERTTQNPSQTRLYEKQKRDGMTLVAMGS